MLYLCCRVSYRCRKVVESSYLSGKRSLTICTRRLAILYAAAGVRPSVMRPRVM